MKKFKRVYIEITNICNLSCSFCPLNKRDKKFMDADKFEHILKEIKPYTEYIYLHLMGEPMMNPYLETILEKAYEYNIKVNITTNGTLLNKVQNIILSSKAVRQINISLHSFEANENANEKEYFNDVINFIKKANKETNIICSMRLWNLDSYSTKGENKLNQDILEFIKESLNYPDDLKEQLEIKKRVKISDRVYLNSAEKFNWPTMEIETLGDIGFCHGLRDHFGILVDGTVVPCCLDGEGHINLGNIFMDRLENILESKRAKEIYEGFSARKRVEELCKRCGYSEMFNK